MIVTFDSIVEDVQAFADDISDVVVERSSGKIIFTKAGKDIEFQVLVEDSTIKNVLYDGQRIAYKKFLTKTIANLDLLAERLFSKRPGIENFIDGPARLDSIELENSIIDKELNLLEKECINGNRFSSKIVFITADAGHGKTALLRQYQHIQADKYLKGKTDFIFWHIDLQGRQLLRLSEAFMGDLGDLRISGLWMSSIIRLLKHGSLVIGIDGFDELAAEQGSNDALGALSLLVTQLENSGTLVAASRRTFFDTEDYLRRSKLISGRLNNLCLFNQINLNDWEREQVLDYLLVNNFDDPESLYNEISSLLGSQKDHPILTRPFLLSQLVTALKKYGISAAEFIGGMSNPQDPNKGVNSIIEAFVKREVQEKWKVKETGEPYLTKEQHIDILSTVAEEMWKAQTDKLDLEIIQTITLLYLDSWGIEDKELRKQIFEMVKMHALLVFPLDGNPNYRRFEHPEFKDYFTSYSLEKQISEAYLSSNTTYLSSFLSRAQITDSLALYTFSNTQLNNCDVKGILEMFAKMIKAEWKPTFLHNNIGILIPYILNRYDLEEMLEFNSKVIYSSLTFENKEFNNVVISNGTFINTSFKGSSFKNVKFIDCQLNEVCFSNSTSFENVEFIDCEYIGLKVENNGDEPQIEYSPKRIREALSILGIKIVDSKILIPFELNIETHQYSKSVHRFLRAMRRTTFISQNNIENWFKMEKAIILEKIIPLMEDFDILEIRKDKGNVWTLKISYQEIATAEFEDGYSNAHLFWKELREKY